ncbi:mucin-5AC-like isoform X2 [Homarus americanus]|uniref:mucin-5AC-like isoform X2 n=1 Tax=Homarus americanus TaxID=6706 RepID=UPI001C480BE7|nr:mucin-5AC-like isoform X2 [Homarus americanus]
MKNPVDNPNGLTMHFRLALDRRKMPSHVDNTELAVQDVLLQELMSLEPVAFHNVAVDIDSLNLARETEAGGLVAAAPSSSSTSSLSKPRDDDDVQVIKVEGTQEAPGGAIMIRKPSGSATRRQEEEGLPQPEVDEPVSSTVANLIYQFGPWRPIDPFNAFRPAPPGRPSSSPAPPNSPTRDNTHSFYNPTVRPPHELPSASRPVASPDIIIIPPSTTTKPTTMTTTTTTTTTTSPTTLTTTTTTTPITTTTTITTSSMPRPTTVSVQFNERVGIAGEGSSGQDDRMITTKRSPSREEFHAFLADLLFFTTPRPQSTVGVTRPQPQLPHRVIPLSESTFSSGQGRPEAQNSHPLNSEDRLVTFQSIVQHNKRRPSYSTSQSSSVSNTATTVSMHTPGSPHVTSYSGVRQPLPPRPPPGIQFPHDKFRYPSSSSSPTAPSAGTTSFSIWDLLTTRKPLILNTELVTSTSTDIEYGSTDQYGVNTQQETTRHYGPVYRPASSSSLAPVYRPDLPAYTHTGEYAATDQYGPIFQSSSEPAPLKDFTDDQNYVTVPVISGNNVRYMMVNRTRTNYPNVVIVNLQATPEGGSTTPMTPTRGGSRRLNTKFLEDAFKAVLQSSNYRGVDRAPNGDESGQGFSIRRGKPIDLDVPDSPAPLLDGETHESISLWSFLRNLSQVYLSDPAIIQQLQYFEKAALEAVNNHRSTTESPLPSTTQSEATTSTSLMTPFFQHLHGSTAHRDTTAAPFLKNTNVVPSRPSPEYTYIPLHGDNTEQQPSQFSPKLGTALRNNPVTVVLEKLSSEPLTTTPPQISPHPFRPAMSSPYTTLFMTGVSGKSSSNPQIISVSSRSPASSSPGSLNMNSPIHTFVLKEGQSMEELLQEIFDTISLEEENETRPTMDAPDEETETTTSESETTYQTTHTADSRSNVLESINEIIFQYLNDMTKTPESQDNHTLTTAPLTTPRTTLPTTQDTTQLTTLDTTKPSTIYETTKASTTVEVPKPSTTRNFNLELFPVMTRPMSPIRLATTPRPYEMLDDEDNEIKTTVIGDGMMSSAEERTETSVDVSYSVHTGTTEHLSANNRTAPACRNLSQFRCGSGECIAEFSRCNLMQDCRDNSDEVNCTCSDFLRSKFLNRKICDGIVDCWDHSDEADCEWCKPGQFICSGSSQCIEQSQVCDGSTDCEGGDDEKTCVTIAPDLPAANSLNYHDEGYLMVRKKGVWGKLCLENFERVTSRAATSWTVSDLGQAVCKTLTFSDFTRVERQEDPSPVNRAVPRLPPGYPTITARTNTSLNNATSPTYFEIHVTNSLTLPSRARSLSHGENTATDLRLSLEFEKTSCPKRDVVRVACSNLQCGMRPRAVSHRARIVGGNNSGPGSWPWHAALYKEGEYQCGATLINHRWLVSAGHCFFGATNQYWVARLGALRRGTKFPSPYEQLRHITHIFIHPEYEDTGFINDISLLRVDEPVKFTDYVRPVCLPPPGSPVRHGRLCTLVGWGQLFEVGKIFPDTLQEVQVPLISTSECRKRTVFIPLYRITEDMFCAGYDRGGRDACLGDSGGPLMCQEPDGGWQLVGVTSNGYGCARPHRPGVYTKVVKYLSWMNQVMELTKSNLVVPVPARCEGHRCPLGQCLPNSNVCNGFVECSDGSDERDCD